MTAGGPTRCSSWGAGSSASASNAPATGARGAKSPPMASTQMRAKLTLPARPLAAHPRSSHTRGIRGGGASSCRTAGTSGSRSPGQSCACCARASCAWRSGASGRPWDYPGKRIKNMGASGRRVAQCAQRIPTRIGVLGATGARHFVTVGTTGRAEPLTLFATGHERRHRQQPRLTNRRPQVDRSRVPANGYTSSSSASSSPDSANSAVSSSDTDDVTSDQTAPARHHRGPRRGDP
jgi:hypothetical protein